MKYSPFKFIMFTLTIFLSMDVNSYAFEPDDYPITDDMLKAAPYLIRLNNSASLGNAWFTNDSLKQAIVINLYTDYHRLMIHHFSTNTIPSFILNSIQLHEKASTGSYISLDYTSRPDFLAYCLAKALRVAPKYFTTNKGFALGMSSQSAVKLYGKPTKMQKTTEGILYTWDFEGDYLYEYQNKKLPEIYAEKSFGYQIEILFQNDKAAGIIMFNDIP